MKGAHDSASGEFRGSGAAMMGRSAAHSGLDLREACLAEALAIISTAGAEKLSLRDVARRLGVSHQAPYRHFASRDHLLAEIVRGAFADFAAALRSPPHTNDPASDLLAMGMAYIGFATAKPLQYRLMFGGSLPDPRQHPEMMQGARDAFNVLRDGIARLLEAQDEPHSRDVVDRNALFAWSSLHGVVSLLQTDAIGTLDLAPQTRAEFTALALQKVGAALGIDTGGNGKDTQ
ncbi:MAG TPA: TetR/AcrR family transcriptional regulator [Erythrobacter sp.]|nr:TetR/AcrR family transcriptional regulator [Erythrobacter sp.]